jgi:hypothetical protein
VRPLNTRMIFMVDIVTPRTYGSLHGCVPIGVILSVYQRENNKDPVGTHEMCLE